MDVAVLIIRLPVEYVPYSVNGIECDSIIVQAMLVTIVSNFMLVSANESSAIRFLLIAFLIISPSSPSQNCWTLALFAK